MKQSFRRLLVLSLLGVSIVAAKPAEQVQQMSWDVGAMPIIKINAFKGSIEVQPWAGDKVQVIVKATAEGKDAGRWLDRVKVSGAPFGAGLAISISQAGSGVEFGLEPAPERTVAVTVLVPVKCNLDLRTTSGDITVANDFEGHMQARVDSGSIVFGRVLGSANLQVGVGDVQVSRTTGDLRVRTRQGDMQIGTIFGHADLRTDSGNIEIMSSRGGIDAEVVTGDIAVGFARELEGDVNVRASAGNVDVAIDPASKLSLQARATWGKVNSKLPLAAMRGGDGKNRIEGLLNGGGRTVALLASGGNVRIASVPTYE